MGRPESTVYDTQAIRDKYGVEPGRLVDVKALMGDASDNIPGVAGIGEKTALALIGEFGTLEALYEKLAEADLRAGVRDKLEKGREMAFMSRRLAEIDRSAPLDHSIFCSGACGDGQKRRVQSIVPAGDLSSISAAGAFPEDTSNNSGADPEASSSPADAASFSFGDADSLRRRETPRLCRWSAGLKATRLSPPPCAPTGKPHAWTTAIPGSRRCWRRCWPETGPSEP
jgi:hypothetical protein